MNALDHVLQIKSAVWLLLLLEGNSERSQSGRLLVLGGRPVFDSEAAGLLKVSRSTITRWRRRLTSLGFIETEPFATGGYLITLGSRKSSDRENLSVVSASQWPSMNSEVVH